MEFGFYQYQTYDARLKLKREGALRDFARVVVTVSQLGERVEYDESVLGIDAEEGVINLHMDQADTGLFVEGKAKLQVNVLYDDARRNVTAKATLKVYDNLHKEVMA